MGNAVINIGKEFYMIANMFYFFFGGALRYYVWQLARPAPRKRVLACELWSRSVIYLSSHAWHDGMHGSTGHSYSVSRASILVRWSAASG